MRRAPRAAVGLLVAAALLGPGCVPKNGDVLGFFMEWIIFLGKKVSDAKPDRRAEKRTAELTTDLSYDVGGLTGTYDVSIGAYGSFNGTTEVRGRTAKVKAADDDATRAMVEAMLLDAYGLEVDVTEVKGSVKGKQTPFGVEARFSGKLKFKGVVLSGPDVDRPVLGTLKGKGAF